ncbi:hypothetical protein EW026_g7288 [Hermanssonia centrifuga]|uniref:DUF6589 domain-containing protein n=1 Tax=Hermanssonia centrifuga TaxID=98765 RepID=A0A4S4KCU0_9APHY|nr:hypothetical protein EW026_g7288 [Hermanssonia centrifuga]
MVFKIAEQILGRTDSQENGTCATVFPLFEALDEDMKTEDLLSSQESAPPLSVCNIILTSEEEIFLRTCLIHTIIRIVVKFGGPAFARFDQDVAASTPITSKQIPIHKTEMYPLPAMNIDESSRIENAEVINTIFKELGYTTANKKSHGKVKIVHGDQLSVSRICSIFERYLSAQVVQDLRLAEDSDGDTIYENALLFMRNGLHIREFTDAIKSGDSDRIVLMLKRLALFYRGTGQTKYAHEMLHLIHNIEHIWPKPLWCVYLCIFRTFADTDPDSAIILKNWLVNPSGRANGFLPVDLLQEHMNFWVKVIYQAQGSGASWDWLETVSPCINVLRALATQMNWNLGSQQGSKHHALDLTNDIRELMKALRTHRVYEKESGRVIDDGTAVPDTFVHGLHGLLGPLRDYNITFERLRARRKVPPLVGKNLSSQTTSPISQDMEEVNESECNRGEGFLGSNGGKKRHYTGRK